MKINYSKCIAVWVWLMVWLGIGYVAYQAQQSRNLNKRYSKLHRTYFEIHRT